MDDEPATAYRTSELPRAVMAEPSPQEGSIGFAGMQLEQALDRLQSIVGDMREALLPVLGEGGEDVLRTSMPTMRDPAPLTVRIMEQVQRTHELADTLTGMRERFRVS